MDDGAHMQVCTDMQVLGPVQVYFCASMLDTGQKRLKCRNNSRDPKKGFDQGFFPVLKYFLLKQEVVGTNQRSLF